MKRFQECNKLEKTWRCRWYLLIPIKWIWFSTVVKIKAYRDEVIDGTLVHTDKYDVCRGKNLWKLLKGSAQGHMEWYHTQEEVDKMFEDFKYEKYRSTR